MCPRSRPSPRPWDRWPRGASRVAAGLAPAGEAGVIGSRDGFRCTSRHRRGLADRVGQADRRPRADGARRRRAPRIWRRTRSSRRSSGGRSRASRTIRAPGSWPPRSIAPSTFSAAARCSSASTSELGHELEARQERRVPDLDAALDDHVGDDLLRLIFIACHPVLSTEARVALTLRLLGGLTTDEIARAFLVPEPTVAQRIVRAKRTLAEARRPVRGAARRRAAPRACRRCSRSSTSSSTRATRRPPATTGCGPRCARTRCGSAASSPGWRRTSRRSTASSR